MASNYGGLNIATKAGEGAANVLQWGTLDRAANQLYQEQKLREQRGYNEYLQGQNELQKEFANIRSADVPDVVNAYNDLKKMRQRIYFDDKIKNDALALANAQREAQIKEANLRQLIAGSRELKDTDKAINQRKITHPEEFDDEKIKQHAVDMGSPLLERIKRGALDATPYLDLSPQTDFAKLSKQATGEVKTVPVGDWAQTPDKYQYELKQVQRPNDPVQYAESMYKSLLSGKTAKDAARIYSQIPPSEIAKIEDNFYAIPDNEFEQRWGVKKSDLVKDFNPDDKAHKFVLLDAMKYATMNMPEYAKSQFRSNEEYKRQVDFEDWLKKNGITSKQAMDRAYLYRQWQREQNQLPEGNLFDTFGTVENINTKKGTVKSQNGLFTDKDSNPYTGELFITKEFVPASVYSALEASGIDKRLLNANQGFNAIIKDGRIQALKDPRIGVVDRQAIENAQLKFNTEPVKGRQMQFGVPTAVQPKKETKTMTLAERMKAAKNK